MTMIQKALTACLPALLLLLFALPGAATVSEQQSSIPEPPALHARGYLLLDYDSGTILAEQGADERLEPASLTKIMTAYVVFRELAADKLSLDDKVTVSEKAWRTGGSRMFIEVGKQVGVEDLIQGMIIQSGNDASVALAEHIAGSEETFAELMNRNAKRLGMTNSHFVNVTGLPDPEHYTTPRDIAKVAAAIIREYPNYYAWYSQPDFTWNDIKQSNRNQLLKLDPSVDGMKTGHTKAAGYCLVSSAKRDGRRLIAVVMGTASPSERVADSQALLNYGFNFFETHRVFPGGEPVESLRVWGGDARELPVGPARDLYITIPRGKYDQLSAQLEPAMDITAPVAWGDLVGEIVFKLGDREIRREPAVALADVGEGNIFQRGWDSVLRLF
ncbi:MAG: D-alanyl-D-alanine carboxypeptidase [Thiohalocapsa sp.]|uniref:D-alanyl-D-alanine carboxypeptidase family protein n=1 Tax=Thiohalocapsa sp. TaxID=2497641 RepID=UPI0025D948C5|nr:D-alanyl-D-alanine carboxypeptidase family protein [Thiohalocapsa sp.]MCG6939873.1 D-alanyl-D-alanine carboxypeptidase [Thiohalocapsa sp.]